MPEHMPISKPFIGMYKSPNSKKFLRQLRELVTLAGKKVQISDLMPVTYMAVNVSSEFLRFVNEILHQPEKLKQVPERRRKMISLTLPPGSGFSPSEEQLCCYYLARKNNAPIDDGGFEGYRGYEAIKELNLYEYHPSALPEYTCFNYGYGARGRHWYFYTKVSDAEVSKRRAVGGFWELQTFDLVNPDWDVTVGNIKVFHFYEGDSRTTGRKTNWVLYEYSLQEKGLFYVCRVFSDSRREKAEAFFKVRKDEVSSSSTASDDSGVPHRGFLTTNTPEATRNPDLFADSLKI